MPILSRLQVPEEFYDRTSPQLLVQPEPQYLYAALWRAAILGGLPGNVQDIVLSGRPALPSNGADYSPEDRDRLMLATGLPAEMFATTVNWAAEPGQTVRFNRPSYADTTYTLSSRKIVTGQSISTTPIGISSEQTALTLYRFGGPYDQVNSRVAPYGLDTFDWSMGIHKVATIAGAHYRRDFTKFVNYGITSLLDNGTAVRPTGFSANNDATATDMFPLDVSTVASVQETLKTSNIAPFGTGKYALVITPVQARQLSLTKDWKAASLFHPDFNILFRGTYLKDFMGFHVFESTTQTTSSNTSSVSVQYGHAFGRDVLMAGMGTAPPGIYPSTDDNYGQTPKAIWLAFLAMGLADSRFVRTVVTA